MTEWASIVVHTGQRYGAASADSWEADRLTADYCLDNCDSQTDTKLITTSPLISSVARRK